MRTFVVLSLLGAIAGWLTRALESPLLLAAVLAVVGVAVVAGYVLTARIHPDSLGITTESAAMVVCLLGALTTLGYRELAVALGIVIAAVLAYKRPLHGLVRRLSWDDIFAGLRLLIATFIVLPLLPNRALDAWGALNPYSLWLLVLLISSLSLVGYVASRSLGPERGVVLTGLTGGLVSSTAVTLAFARQSRDDQGRVTVGLGCGLVLAWSVMFVRVVAEVAIVNPNLLMRVAVPFGAMGAAAVLVAWGLWRRMPEPGGDVPQAGAVSLRNPFSLTEAAKFGAFFALVLLGVKVVQQRSPGEGLYLLAGLAGLTDVDAITLSMADYARSGDGDVAVNAIVIATLANTVVKSMIAAVLGSRTLARLVLLATAAILIAGGGALLWA